MKAFLLFLSGALLGSVAAWFIWLGQVGPEADTTSHAPAAPSSVPVTSPPPKRAAPQSRPAIRRGTPEPTPPQMIPVEHPAPGDDAPTQASAPAMPVDAKQSVALPPESTPVPPVAAGGVLL